MDGASINVAVAGEARIEQRLHALAASFGDLFDLMDGIGLYLESATDERFDKEIAPDGSKWEPSQRVLEQGGKTLTKTPRLRPSVTHLASRDEVEVGTNVKYAPPHQSGIDEQVSVKAHERTIYQAFGRPLPGGLNVSVGAFTRQMTMPQREFLGVNDDDEAEIMLQAEEYALDAVPEIER
ncbi:MAG: phage virion morphogenesis protein [Blastomonas sp.]